MRRLFKQFTDWALTPAVKPVLRDFIGVYFLLLQGTIRVIDGVLFTLVPTRILSNDIYGFTQVALGVWLLATRRTAAGRVGGKSEQL